MQTEQRDSCQIQRDDDQVELVQSHLFLAAIRFYVG
jgi:hypothetical protein